jgi:hypothetical protein
MEYNFISKATLDDIISKYISSLPENQQEKALVDKNLFEWIKKILLDPSNKEIDTKSTHEWAKKRFILEEISPGDYRIIIISASLNFQWVRQPSLDIMSINHQLTDPL